MFRYPTVVGSPHMLLVHMSTNGSAYPHIVWAYPHLGTRAKPPEIRLFWSLSPSLGVQHLPEGTDVPAEVVVLRHLALDLFAAVEDRRVVAAPQGLADAHKGRLRLLAHEVHRDLTRQDHLLVGGLAPQLVRRTAVIAATALHD